MQSFKSLNPTMRYFSLSDPWSSVRTADTRKRKSKACAKKTYTTGTEPRNRVYLLWQGPFAAIVALTKITGGRRLFFPEAPK